MYENEIIKARTLVEALPYIQHFKGKTVIIKYGGSLMVNPQLQKVFASDIVLMKCVGINPVIVHGGGKEISKWMSRVGKEAVFIDGLRFTDDETMELTEMVLSGKINNQLVSLLNQHGGKAVGLSGKDGDFFMARKIQSKTYQDLGFVGDIESVDSTLLDTLLEKGFIPVIASVARSQDGETLNMNADHVAEGIAQAVCAEKLIFMTDVQGVFCDEKLIPYLTMSDAKTLLDHPDIKGGMIPKLTCSIRAIENGVERVHIVNGSIEHAVLLEIFTDVGIGTMLEKESK